MAGKLAAAVAVAVLAVPVLIAAGIAGVVSAVTGSSGPATCTTTAAHPPTQVAGYQGEQLGHAATIIAVGNQMRVPARGQVVALAAAMQESRLRNLDYGDRDSLGLFQQRPSQGWGTPSQIRDPTHAATQFYRQLLALPGWQAMSVNDAAQRVQRSATPTAYAKHAPAARTVLAALSGATCTASDLSSGRIRTTWAPQQATEPDPTSGGQLTPRTLALVHALKRTGLTGTGLGCHAPRPANPNSDHPHGRACDIMFNPHSNKSVARGWRTANWLIANQARLGVKYLIWQGKYWSAYEPAWVPYRSSNYGCPDPTNLTGCHYDHIHVSLY